MADDRLTALDTAFLCLESVHAPMHLGALAIFHPTEPVKPAHLVSLLGDRADRLPWLRRRVGLSWLPPGAAVWVEDRLFSAKRHIHLHQLDGGDPDEVAASAAELMADPLNLSRPLWEVHIITGLSEGRFALLVKLHHALADGLRAAELGLALLDGFTDLALASPPPALADGPADVGPGRPDPAVVSLSGMARALRSAAGSAASSAAGIAARPDQLLAHLGSAAATVPSVARHVGEIAGIAGSILSSARLTGPASPLAASSAARAAADRRLALLQLPIGEIRQIRRRHGGTDNDILLAVLTGALRDWLAHQGEAVDRLQLRALIPVSRRARPNEQRRGNVLSGYLCDLPVHESDPLARLSRIRTTMDRNKAAGPGRGPGAIPVLAERVPAAMHRVVTPLTRQSAGRLFDTIVTNVPLPPVPLTLAGAPLREVYPIAPLAHGHSLGIAMSAHRGNVHIGLHGSGPAGPLSRLANSVPAALGALQAAGTAGTAGTG
jgi:WS/DGAT/MGAT family acyltransferase